MGKFYRTVGAKYKQAADDFFSQHANQRPDTRVRAYCRANNIALNQNQMTAQEIEDLEEAEKLEKAERDIEATRFLKAMQAAGEVSNDPEIGGD